MPATDDGSRPNRSVESGRKSWLRTPIGLSVLVLVGLMAYFMLQLSGAIARLSPVPDTSVRAADIREVLPTMLPEGGTPSGIPKVHDVRCKPLTPASATTVLHVPVAEEDIELALRRQMAELRWRDLPDRSRVGPTSVTMRFERGLGDGEGTVTYVLTGTEHATAVHLSLIGSISGRCGVR